MLLENNIDILRKLLSQYNYVIITVEPTASKLYYTDIKLSLEKGFIKNQERLLSFKRHIKKEA